MHSGEIDSLMSKRKKHKQLIEYKIRKEKFVRTERKFRIASQPGLCKRDIADEIRL